jgi:hypothetical protein
MAEDADRRVMREYVHLAAVHDGRGARTDVIAHTAGTAWPVDDVEGPARGQAGIRDSHEDRVLIELVIRGLRGGGRREHNCAVRLHRAAAPGVGVDPEVDAAVASEGHVWAAVGEEAGSGVIGATGVPRHDEPAVGQHMEVPCLIAIAGSAGSEIREVGVHVATLAEGRVHHTCTRDPDHREVDGPVGRV